VVEIEPALIDLVREHLPLPRGAAIRIRIGDARAALAKLPPAMTGQVDLLVSDVYSGAQTPAHLTSVEFYRAAARMLAPDGVLLVNVADGAGLAFARAQVATVRAVLPHAVVLAEVQVLKGRRFGNLVIAASPTPLPTQWLPRLLAAGPHPAKVAEGAELDEFERGALPVTDASAVDSPKPKESLFER
jgi:spermidine synthase